MIGISRNVLGSLLCGYLLCVSLGCSCDATRHPVNVSLSPEFKETPSITVVITALTADESNYMANYPMSKFFQPGDNQRGGLNKVEMQFGPNQPTGQSFSPASKDQWEQHWKYWEARKATELFVMAFIPGHFDDQKGSLDPRRQMVPLGSCKWDKPDQPINFQISRAKLELLTPPKQGK